MLFATDSNGWPARLVSDESPGNPPTGHVVFSGIAELESWKAANQDKRPVTQQSNPTPTEVPLWKLREVLALKGLLAQVESVIAAIPDANKRAVAKNRFEYKETIERNHPLTVQLVTAIGLTSKQADEIFQAAEAL